MRSCSTRKATHTYAIFAVLVATLAIVAMMPTSAFANEGNCPASGTGNPQTDSKVAASFTISGDTATYTFSSLENESSSGGIPGLIGYCVYPGLAQPTSTTTLAVGANGEAWVDPVEVNFSFQRPDGNPSNIPLDGTTGITIGTATWSGGAPESQTILLHINDEAVCSSLYGGNLETCFVLPGEEKKEHNAQDLEAEKSATPTFEHTFKWTIKKSVDKTVVRQIGGGSATFNYTVTVTHQSEDGGWKVSGGIKVTNPNAADVTGVNVSDALNDPNATCSVEEGTNATIPAEKVITFSYTCTYSAAPESSSQTNTANVTWQTQTLANGDTLAGNTLEPTAAVEWSGVTPALVDDCVNVTDSLFGGELAKLCVNASGEQSSENVASGVTVSGTGEFVLKYAKTVTVPQFECEKYTNTATFTTNTSRTTGSAEQTVEVCGPARTGALTIGFWKTTNGQSLIKTYCQNPALANYLKGLGGGSGPFSNAPTTKCSDLATYVYSILSGASATNMNAMLKAQMLGTALDVWFSGPGWTATKIGAVKPPSSFLSHNNLGTFKMDTTAVCPMVDSLKEGTATCQNKTPSTNAVAAGAAPTSPMTMQALLDFAASTPSPFNGSTSNSIWYGANKTTEELLKNIFDQFNNGLAFGSF